MIIATTTIAATTATAIIATLGTAGILFASTDKRKKQYQIQYFLNCVTQLGNYQHGICTFMLKFKSLPLHVNPFQPGEQPLVQCPVVRSHSLSIQFCAHMFWH